MFALNRLGVRSLPVYLAGFALLWLAVLLSGIHATIAGVLAAFTIPIVKTPGKPDATLSPLHRLEHALDVPVAFCIVPLVGLDRKSGVSGKSGSVRVSFRGWRFLKKKTN